MPARGVLRQRPSLSTTIVLVLTLGTGAVDAVSYFSLDHVFTANMSGNIALLGIGLVTDFGSVAGNAFAFAGFVVGSVLVARLFRWRSGSQLRTTVEALVLELVLLGIVTVIMAAVDTREVDAWRFVVCGVLAAAMGVQTGIARHLAVKDVNTTVATMTLHDLAAASRLAGGDSVRWVRRGAVIAGLLAGAAIGVRLDEVVRWGGTAFSLACLVLVTALALRSAARETASTTSSTARLTLLRWRTRRRRADKEYDQPAGDARVVEWDVDAVRTRCNGSGDCAVTETFDSSAST